MSPPLKRYLAYGLTLASDIDLPELLPAPPGNLIDVTIRRANLLRPEPEGPQGFAFSPDVQHIDFRSVAKFDICGTSEIYVDPHPDIAANVVRLPLLGTIMALLLHMRGAYVLHASAVLMGSKGVAFLGDKRAGKSTTAGALVSRGYPLITDDVLALSFESGLRLVPGFPQMKLTKESSTAVSLDELPGLPPLDFPGFDKFQHQIGDHFSNASAEPKRLYILDRGEQAAVEPLSVTEAFQGLMRFSYLVRFGKDVISTKTAPNLMKQSAQIAGLGIVKRLIVPNQLERLSEAVSKIEEDLAS